MGHERRRREEQTSQLGEGECAGLKECIRGGRGGEEELQGPSQGSNDENLTWRTSAIEGKGSLSSVTQRAMKICVKPNRDRSGAR